MGYHLYLSSQKNGWHNRRRRKLSTNVTGLVGQFRIYGERLAPHSFFCSFTIQNILTG